MTETNISAETVNVDLKAATPGIGMPDHPIRHRAAYQAFDRLWRPAAGWVTVAGLAYAFIIAPWRGEPLSEGYLVQVLLFAGAMLGLKSFEKVKGVA